LPSYTVPCLARLEYQGTCSSHYILSYRRTPLADTLSSIPSRSPRCGNARQGLVLTRNQNRRQNMGARMTQAYRGTSSFSFPSAYSSPPPLVASLLISLMPVFPVYLPRAHHPEFKWECRPRVCHLRPTIRDLRSATRTRIPRGPYGEPRFHVWEAQRM
jgi:hypothetical protein